MPAIFHILLPRLSDNDRTKNENKLNYTQNGGREKRERGRERESEGEKDEEREREGKKNFSNKKGQPQGGPGEKEEKK